MKLVKAFKLKQWEAAGESSIPHISLDTFNEGKDYSGTKFFYTEPLFLNKAH